jgi:Ni,Fe-hydrogenase III large subunit
LLLGAAPVWAVLGQSVRSVQSDQQYWRGTQIEVARQGYALHQISAANGTVVREYVSNEGTVFGVSWRGPTMPNLSQLLGPYFAEFQQASQSPHRRRGPLVVRTDRVVIESGGHLRAFHGRAYVPNLVPRDLTEAVVQ